MNPKAMTNETREIVSPLLKADLSYMNSIVCFPVGTTTPLKIPFTIWVWISSPSILE